MNKPNRFALSTAFAPLLVFAAGDVIVDPDG
jgi:hypothetical protein